MLLGITVTFIGVVLLLERVGVIESGFSKYWPVILIAFGLSLVFDRWRKRE